MENMDRSDVVSHTCIYIGTGYTHVKCGEKNTVVKKINTNRSAECNQHQSIYLKHSSVMSAQENHIFTYPTCNF